MNSEDNTAYRTAWGMRRWIRFALSMLAGAGLLFYLLWQTDMSVLRDLGHAQWRWICLLCACTLAMSYTVGLRWQWITLGMSGRSFRAVDLAFFFNIGMLLTYVMPKGVADLAARSLALRLDADYPLREGFYSVAIDRIFDLAIIAVFLIPSLVLLTGERGLMTALIVWLAVPSGAILLLAAFHYRLILLALWAYNGILRLLAGFPGIGKKLVSLSISTREIEFMRKRNAFLKLVVCSLAKFGLNALRFFAVARAFSLGISFQDILISLPVAQGANIIIGITPAGLGVLEGGWAAGFSSLSIAPRDTAMFLVGQRVYVFLAVLAACGILFLLRLWAKKQG